MLENRDLNVEFRETGYVTPRNRAAIMSLYSPQELSKFL
jgi:hypothetical protein